VGFKVRNEAGPTIDLLFTKWADADSVILATTSWVLFDMLVKRAQRRKRLPAIFDIAYKWLFLNKDPKVVVKSAEPNKFL
jgi:hypothetical protein